MREFEETGIYPEYLLFNLPGTRQSWRVKIRKKPQTGLLKRKWQPFYEYNFDGVNCFYRKIDKSISYSEWIVQEFTNFEMID